jgi:hypothetical protein
MSDINQQKQWEPEPPPEGGYDVIRIQPYGVDADEFVKDITEMSRCDKEMAGISAFGVGLDLDENEMVCVQLGGLRHDGFGNLILEKRERLKEVVNAEKKARLEEFQKMVDDLVKQIESTEVKEVTNV